MKEKWFIKNTAGNFDVIGRTHGIDPVLAKIIVGRGINSNEEMAAYLHPSLENLHEPKKMKDMIKACEIIKEKIKTGKKIRIIGDYDADGVMSTYILLKVLEDCGADVDYEIPDRIKDGYGINIQIVEAAYQDGIDTILTCDNGIAAFSQIEYAKEKGMTVVITDHHDIPIEEGVPKAAAVVNPKQADCNYPYEGICGAMITYKFAQVLYEMFGFDDEKVQELIQFAAIATVCDVMDLCNENRIIVKYGLKQIEQTKNIGLRALVKACQLDGIKLSQYHLGFVIGPCINATGRLESAKMSLDLLRCKKKDEAEKLARRLRELNDERKAMTEQGVEKAIEVIETTELKKDKILVVYLKECHESLAGIIAGRIRERYNKPTLVLTKTEHGVKGSGRSIEEYNMFEGLSAVKHLLTKFGGHPMAAGLSLEEANVEELRRALNEKTTLTEEDLMPKVSFDLVLPADHVNNAFIHSMECMEPTGKGNAKPLFVWKNAKVERATIVGANKNVLKLRVRGQGGQTSCTAMLFSNIKGFEETVNEKYGQNAFLRLQLGETQYEMDLVFSLSINEYNGLESPQIILQNYR